MFKKIITTGILISGMMFTGCSEQSEFTENIVQSVEVKKDLLTTLNDAKKIKVEEKLVSVGAAYNVFADDVKVGEIRGRYVNATGDIFTLTDLDGNVVKSEKQIKRWGVKLNRLAKVYNENGNITGYIGEEKIKDAFSWGYKFHFYDDEKVEIGYSKQKIISLTDVYEVYDMDKNLDYVIEEEVVSLTPSYEIKINDNSNIRVEDVVLYTAIQNEIDR